jgi:hypothetical protein
VKVAPPGEGAALLAAGRPQPARAIASAQAVTARRSAAELADR